MSTCSRLRVPTTALGLVLVTTLLVGCDSSSPKGSAGVESSGGASLLKVEFGRLVDIYSYRRVDVSKGDRRDSLNRSPVLLHSEVVVDASIESQPLFDSVGEENIGADYRFMPFDIRTGHEELLILHDDRFEKSRFQDALDRARSNLVEIAASYRDQNTGTRPIPVVPRNAALVMTFDRDLGSDLSFFTANPAAVQVLEIRGDPNVLAPPDALQALPFRILPRGNTLVLDPTILGDERGSIGATTLGLPASSDSVSANIRLAVPSRGGVSSDFRVEEDRIGPLNDLDSTGRMSVIRDFRAGNPQDGRVGALVDVESPMIVGDFKMGIIAIDLQENVLTINKRFRQVAVRGRLPFVDGAIDGNTGLPKGPTSVPTIIPLRSGDILSQEVDVLDALGIPTGEVLRVRAEILQNLAVGTVEGDPDLPFLGRARDETEAESDAIMRVRVADLVATDSEGNVIFHGNGDPVTFESNTLPLGADCLVRVHYYENVPSAIGGKPTTDNDPDPSIPSRRVQFLVLDPTPLPLDENRNAVPLGSNVDPLASVAIRFSEPMDLDSVDTFGNLLLTNSSIDAKDFFSLIQEAKPAVLSILDTRLFDINGDGTLLNLSPRLGHFHSGPRGGNTGTAEQYWFHLLLGEDGLTDVAQNTVDVFDLRLEPVDNFSVDYSIDAESLDNLVGSRILRFESADEDGTRPGSVDMFGQFSLQGGRLLAAATTRFSLTADNQNLGSILRYTRGECYSPSAGATIAPIQHPGTLFQTPSMVGSIANPPLPFGADGAVGRVIEPHQPRGSRLQMTYREEDFGMSQTDPSQFGLDIEQMYWAPYNDRPVLYDRFDRYSLSLGHANKRPDLRFFFDQDNQICFIDCASLNSGLATDFASNVLEGTSMVQVVKDQAYEINPNDAFRSPSSGVKYVPYPEFQTSYTWRDERLVTWDPVLNIALGLGGAQEPKGLFPNQDTTASMDSPWGLNRPPSRFDQRIYVLDEGDFSGTRIKDHSPIALPLLMDFKVFPDDGSFPVAQGVNAFHVALVGPTFGSAAIPGGYYNATLDVGCQLPFPLFRVHQSGGFDQNTGLDTLVNPETTLVANSTWIKDAGLGDPTLGQYNAPAGEGQLHWAQADFVRKVSVVTFGFFDTLQPNRHALGDLDPPFSDWPGVNVPEGFPDFAAAEADFGSLRASDLILSMDPPLIGQPEGTGVVVEFRGLEEFDTDEQRGIYDPFTDDRVENRGNLLNPNYSCEAFRYAMPNAGGADDSPRVKVGGMTPYVQSDLIHQIKDRNGLLPRYLNFRVIFENNVDATPASSPALKGLAISYRMRPGS